MAKVFKVPRKSRVYLKHRITNAVCEGLNSKIQSSALHRFTLVAPGETESGSAEEQPDKG